MVIRRPIDPLPHGERVADAEIAAAAGRERGDEKTGCFHWPMSMREEDMRKGRNPRGAHAPSRVAERALAVCWLERSSASPSRTNARSIASQVSGEGAENSTRWRVRSPIFSRCGKMASDQPRFSSSSRKISERRKQRRASSRASLSPMRATPSSLTSARKIFQAFFATFPASGLRRCL